MSPRIDRPYRGWAIAALRIAAGLAFFTHGGQKLFGWFGGFGGGGTAELMSRFGVAGVIEVFLGAAIVLGLFTRFAAFICSGEMAVTYFWMHWGGSGGIFWWQNRGELPLLYTFIFLLFVAVGPGAWSVDGWLKARKREASPGGAGGG